MQKKSNSFVWLLYFYNWNDSESYQNVGLFSSKRKAEKFLELEIESNSEGLMIKPYYAEYFHIVKQEVK